MSSLALATGVFTAIVVVLAALVLMAKHWLAPSGEVAVVVNGRRSYSLPLGQKLLWSLAAEGIYLPAACGGRGTCGQCRVVVNGARRRLLPTEAVHITRADADRGVRLACMLTVHDALDIAIAEDLLDARRWTCTVASSRSISPFLKELVLELPENERIDFEAGEYVLLEAPAHKIRFDELPIDADSRLEWQRLNLLKLVSETHEQIVRAYSLANPPQLADRIVLVVRIAVPPGSAPPGTPPGHASSYVFALRPGDRVSVSGPFGEFHARESQREMVFIAGGVGIAPIRSIVLDQLARDTRRRMSLWYGVRNARELCYGDEFRELARRHENFSFHAAFSDAAHAGAAAHTGLIHTVVLENYLASHRAPEDIDYYLCGPPLMTTAVTQMLEDLGVEPEQILFDDFGAT